jgi:hypothetical protein
VNDEKRKSQKRCENRAPNVLRNERDRKTYTKRNAAAMKKRANAESP